MSEKKTFDERQKDPRFQALVARKEADLLAIEVHIRDRRIARLERATTDFLYAHAESAGMRGAEGCDCAACRMFRRALSKGKKR